MPTQGERLVEAVRNGPLTEDQAFDIQVMWAHQEEERCTCDTCSSSKRLLRRIGLWGELHP